MVIRERPPTAFEHPSIRRAGVIGLVAGLIGALAGIVLALLPAQVPPGRYSYPLATGSFVALQVLFFLQHLGLVVTLLGVRRSGATGIGVWGAWGLAAAVTGMGLLALVELVAISAASSGVSDQPSGLLNVLYGATSTLIGLGLVIAGAAVLRARTWTGWRRVLVLVLGIYVFVALTPALAGPFALARLAIAVWMLLFAALGWALMNHGARQPVG